MLTIRHEDRFPSTSPYEKRYLEHQEFYNAGRGVRLASENLNPERCKDSTSHAGPHGRRRSTRQSSIDEAPNHNPGAGFYLPSDFPIYPSLTIGE